jgi:hypothetical protein
MKEQQPQQESSGDRLSAHCYWYTWTRLELGSHTTALLWTRWAVADMCLSIPPRCSL